jgi:hydrogenase-4 component F
MILWLIILLPLGASVASFLVKKNMLIFNRIAMSASFCEFMAALAIVMAVIRNRVYRADRYFSVEAMGAVLMILLAIVGAMVSWYSAGYLKIEVRVKIIGFSRVRQYFILLHLFTMAMCFAIMTTNPILMWIAIEATTLSTAFLISFYNKPTAIEAAWKYLIVNSVGLLLGFFGTLLFLYPAMRAGHQGLIDWQTLLVHTTAFDPLIAKIAFIFVLIGYGTKVGFVPMHTWLPDAHSKAPAPISSLLSGVLLNVAFFAVLRFKSIVDPAIGPRFSRELLIFFGVMSLAVAALLIYNQKNYKRLLAYSSIEHMGIIALGFGFGGAGAFAALLHMIYHSLAKSALFLSSGNIILKYKSTKIVNVRGMREILPVTSVLFIIGFLAITGVPPFGIFLTEFSILATGIGSHPLAVTVVLLALALVFIGFLRHISAMIFEKNERPVPMGENGSWTNAPIIVLIVLLLLAGFFIPQNVRALLQSATAIY